MNKICFGCGAKLQSENPEALGYIPSKKKNNAVYCMRCFRLMHYGEERMESAPKENDVIVKRVNEKPHFSIFLVDFINLNEEVLSLYKAIKTPKVLVVNKCELLPKQIRKDRVRDFIAKHYEIEEPILLKGGIKRHGIESIVRFLEKEHIHETYILGLSNAGKSTFINDLLTYCCSSAVKTVTSKRANTTVDFIRVPVNDQLLLIDSPGFILEKSLKQDTTGKDIKAITFQMKEGETVSLLNEQYFFKFEDATSITFYTNEVEKPMRKFFKAAPDLIYTIDVTEENTDIVLKGIGFITVKKITKITTNVDPKYIEVRKSMFGGPYE